jgi:hypothetical protein
MPAAIFECALCGRKRRLGKLTLDWKLDEHDAPVFYYRCANGCLPTKWEARRERKQQNKILSELKDWTEKS